MIVQWQGDFKQLIENLCWVCNICQARWKCSTGLVLAIRQRYNHGIKRFSDFQYNYDFRVQAKKTEELYYFSLPSQRLLQQQTLRDMTRITRCILSVASCGIETLYPLSQISEQIRRAQRVPLQYSLYMSRRENHITMLNDIRGLAPRVRATLSRIIPRPPPASLPAISVAAARDIY